MAPQRQTHCKRGHELTEANTYIGKQPGDRPGIRRACRICMEMHQYEYRERKREKRRLAKLAEAEEKKA